MVALDSNENTPILSSEQEDVEEEEPHEEPEEEDEEKEVWYGWVVVAASFLCNLVIDGMGYSFGVMLEPLMHEFHVGAGSVSFVGSLLNGVIMLSAPLAAAFINKFGPRLTCITGALISSVSIFLSSYSNSLAVLLISYGIFGGIGLGLMYVPAVVAVGQYFSKRLNLATGICVCGSGVGTFLFAPIASDLIERFGWRGSNRVMALFCLLCTLLGLAMVPKLRIRKRSVGASKTKIIDLQILKNVPFLLYILSNIPTLMGVYSTYSYLPAMGRDSGLSSQQASFLISMIGISSIIINILSTSLAGITNTLGRVVSGYISDIKSVSPIIVNIIATLISAIFPILLSKTLTYPMLLVLTALLGLSLSPLPTVTSGVIVQLLTPGKLNDAFGVLTFVRGGAALLGPPLAGYMADTYSDFSIPFTMATVQLGVSMAVCCGSYLVLRRRDSQHSGYQEI